MDMSLQKRSRSGPLAILVRLSVLGCCVLATNLVLADASSAATLTPKAGVPESGLDCVEASGKIAGRGSTYQNNLQEEVAKLYRDDYCGATGTETAEDKVGGKERGEPGSTMLAYNTPAEETAGVTGSGAGLRGASCRTDAFEGTDLPYNNTQLKELEAAAGTLTETGEKKSCTSGGLAEGKFLPPFQPNSPASWPDKEAGKEDTTAPLMSFPVGGSSAALAVHLTEASCGGTKPPTSLEFTAKEVSRLFGGDVAKWSDPELVKNNPGLTNCTAEVTRVVRFDNSGTTNIFKSYLVRAENERTAQKCAEGKHWSTGTSEESGKGEYFEPKNEKWPGKQAEEKGEKGAEGTCSKIITAGTSGGPALIKVVGETPAAIGYADLSDAVGHGLTLANVVNAAGTKSTPPNVGNAANCTYSVVSLPGSSGAEAVGLNSADDWSNNNEANAGKPGNHENPTDLGVQYPICGLTFDLVYTGLQKVTGANPVSRLSANQRRTLYSYMSFLLSSTAQDEFQNIDYAPLPVTWLPTLREGFQENF